MPGRWNEYMTLTSLGWILVCPAQLGLSCQLVEGPSKCQHLLRDASGWSILPRYVVKSDQFGWEGEGASWRGPTAGLLRSMRRGWNCIFEKSRRKCADWFSKAGACYLSRHTLSALYLCLGVLRGFNLSRPSTAPGLQPERTNELYAVMVGVLSSRLCEHDGT
jgi:hypothetical protein